MILETGYAKFERDKEGRLYQSGGDPVYVVFTVIGNSITKFTPNGYAKAWRDKLKERRGEKNDGFN